MIRLFNQDDTEEGAFQKRGYFLALKRRNIQPRENAQDNPGSKNE